ncbi:Serum response factor-binding 1 [Labeo rohita]|uniref:Serum response factor-binding 1 n=1 Tax=Labeo rohita TaxID=84645 RepID=A0A498NX16_LABRO|nr:Serum response factor-binding 1 [Labeo rohita]
MPGSKAYSVLGVDCPAGLVRDLNPGPLAPEARIIPLDQRANVLPAQDNEQEASKRSLLPKGNTAQYGLHKMPKATTLVGLEPTTFEWPLPAA